MYEQLNKMAQLREKYNHMYYVKYEAGYKQ